MPLFCILAHDKPDAAAPARRQAARGAHFHRARLPVDRGQVHFAGSMLAEDGTMRASILIVDFPTRAALEAWLAEEPHVLNGAWERTEVAPLFVAVQDGKITRQWLGTDAPDLGRGLRSPAPPRGRISAVLHGVRGATRASV